MNLITKAMPDQTQMLYDIEVHSVDGIKKYFADGGSPNDITGWYASVYYYGGNVYPRPSI